MMKPFTVLESRALPLIRDNIDTDTIIPSREMKSVAKTGLAEGLFAGWRYTTVGGRTPDLDFILNDPAFEGAQILLGGRNFGCGSSREHAVWALVEYGFRAIIAPSFNALFRNNCVRNGLLPVELDPQPLARELQRVRIDLPAQTVAAGEQCWPFAIDEEAKVMLVNGYDAIDLTLRRADEIARFRAADQQRRPWAYL